jgi:hypothetical protein
MAIEATAPEEPELKEISGLGDSQDAVDDLEHGSSRSTPVDNAEEKNSTSNDPNIVDWDGPDDPTNPLNWPTKKKSIIVATISFITFLTYESTSSHSFIR